MWLPEDLEDTPFNPQRFCGYGDYSFHLKSVTKFQLYLIYIGDPGLGPIQDFQIEFEFEFDSFKIHHRILPIIIEP